MIGSRMHPEFAGRPRVSALDQYLYNPVMVPSATPASAATVTKPQPVGAPPATKEEQAGSVVADAGRDPRDSTGYVHDIYHPSRGGPGWDRAAFNQNAIDNGGWVARNLARADNYIQESQGLAALAPLGMFGGAGLPLAAAKFSAGTKGMPTGGSIMGIAGRQIGRLFGPQDGAGDRNDNRPSHRSSDPRDRQMEYEHNRDPNRRGGI